MLVRECVYRWLLSFTLARIILPAFFPYFSILLPFFYIREHFRPLTNHFCLSSPSKIWADFRPSPTACSIFDCNFYVFMPFFLTSCLILCIRYEAIVNSCYPHVTCAPNDTFVCLYKGATTSPSPSFPPFLLYLYTIDNVISVQVFVLKSILSMLIVLNFILSNLNPALPFPLFDFPLFGDFLLHFKQL